VDLLPKDLADIGKNPALGTDFIGEIAKRWHSYFYSNTDFAAQFNANTKACTQDCGIISGVPKRNQGHVDNQGPIPVRLRECWSMGIRIVKETTK